MPALPLARELGQRRRAHDRRLRRVDGKPGQRLERLQPARSRSGKGFAEVRFLAALGPVPASHLIGRPRRGLVGVATGAGIRLPIFTDRSGRGTRRL